MKRGPKPTRCTLDLVTEAGKLVRAAGFEFVCASMKTEACYYRWPGRRGLLRIAAHRKRNEGIGEPVVATVTFNGTHLDRPGTMKIGNEVTAERIAAAIGRYLIKTGGSDVTIVQTEPSHRHHDGDDRQAVQEV